MGHIRKCLINMAGTTGLEPATSAVTVLRRRKHLPTPNERKPHVEIVSMRFRRIYRARCVYPSDTEQTHARRAGMAGLRHKSRHKHAACDRRSKQPRSRVGHIFISTCPDNFFRIFDSPPTHVELYALT